MSDDGGDFGGDGGFGDDDDGCALPCHKPSLFFHGAHSRSSATHPHNPRITDVFFDAGNSMRTQSQC